MPVIFKAAIPGSETTSSEMVVSELQIDEIFK